MDENSTAEFFSRRFTGIQNTILGWNDKELDDGLSVNVYPIHYESCVVIEENWVVNATDVIVVNVEIAVAVVLLL